MFLTKTWAPYFSSAIRLRGRAYQQQQRVTPLPPKNGELIRAEVRGQQTYTVTISREGGHAAATCTCDYFHSGRFCKHIWATIVDVQQRPDSWRHPDQADADAPPAPEQPPSADNGGSDATANAPGDVDGVHGSSPEDNGAAVPIEKIEGVAPRLPKARKRNDTEPRLPSPHREPEWLGRLSLLRPAAYLQRTDSVQLLPEQRQICFVVVPEYSRRHNGLVVELRQRTPIASGWSKPKRFRLTSDLIDNLPDPTDRELCGLILGAAWVDPHEMSEPPRPERGHTTFRLPHGAWRSLLARMIATGRCFVADNDDPAAEAVPLIDDGLLPATVTAEQPGDVTTAAGAWTLWMRGRLGSMGADEVADADATTEQPSDEPVEPTAQATALHIGVELRRGDQILTIDRPALLLGGRDGLVIHAGKAAAFDDRGAFRWAGQFRDEWRKHGQVSPIVVPRADVPRFLDRLYMLPHLPEIDLPPGIGRTARRVTPRPQVELYRAEGFAGAAGLPRGSLVARVTFLYDTHRVRLGQPGRFVSAAAQTADARPAEDEHDLILRDLRAEADALATLASLGLRQISNGIEGESALLQLPSRQMASAAAHLLARNWAVFAEQQALATPGTPTLSITSGIDWFELRGTVTFRTAHGEQHVSLPQILAAAKAGKQLITLGDGSEGLLPEQWLREHSLLTTLGRIEGDHLRFRSAQAVLLDTLLDRQELVDVDEKFAEARRRLDNFRGIEPLAPADSFVGTLRPYQRDGLGWMRFLRWFGMGGVLADDMGLGKTIQILAMLDARYGPQATGDQGEPQTDRHRPSLIVVPRSVVFNWIDEAARFAPTLRVQAYTGADRQSLRDAFIDHDVIVTSYGLMRRDIDELRKHEFDYVVLDEAQAIKNPQSQSAKAARLLRAEHRLALTGTPVENHLGDLWSIFEFLNPGMLGSSGRFGELLRSASADRRADRDLTVAAQIGNALRPFILRRTKKQVLKDLPEKTEQTILCEMEDAQRAVYEQLRTYYRGTLLNQGGPGTVGPLDGRGAMMVLEALLRLRQAACHPGLIDPAHSEDASAKLEVLLDRLADLIDEGHKALVFSQFTSMLAIVRRRLEERGIVFEYLDGQTRDRRAPVERFQNDADCPVFLISLKAGGLGLNLTAAEYVFILDPWWNPAVEAQAIDRTHRIGQTRHVFAYRLICENTVEQRIAELQQKKQQLADAIIGGQETLLRNLTREDLDRLLS